MPASVPADAGSQTGARATAVLVADRPDAEAFRTRSVAQAWASGAAACGGWRIARAKRGGRPRARPQMPWPMTRPGGGVEPRGPASRRPLHPQELVHAAVGAMRVGLAPAEARPLVDADRP